MVIRNETSMFLSPLKPEATRQRRGTALGMAALAAVGLFGSGLVMRKSDSCGLRGIFGGCHDQTKANAKNIRTISEVQDVLTVFVTDLSTNTDEKFFLEENELAALQAIQAEMSRTQNTNWAIFQEQFDIYADNFHILRDCDQLFFANQQLNFNFDISSLLAMCHASVKNYRSALFAFRMNLLNSIPVLLQGHLPMSSIPMESLLAILDRVAFQQA